MKRVFLIVLDSFGIGKMPDAEKFGDKEVNTLARISASKKFSAKNMINLGLANIDGVNCLPKQEKVLGAYARLVEASSGKDTTIGHWEIAGIYSKEPLPTYPNGFPNEILNEFTKQTGKGVLCNAPYSGTKVIEDFGQEHLETGKLIVYTSADSVFQIAAHTDIVPLEQLYEYCKIARAILKGKHAVGRVIARPFADKDGKFYRTAGRHDFSLMPPEKTVLESIKQSGKEVYAIGKITDIFAGVGITKTVLTKSNKEGMQETIKALNTNFNGLCFVNLVDFDMLYGHRQDIDGYAAAISEFDVWLKDFLSMLKDEDILMITADHGCDPGDEHTDHTREYTPLLVYGKKVKPVNLATRSTFSDIAATIGQYLEIEYTCGGTSFLNKIM